MRKVETLEDLADWHYDMAKDMYRAAKRAKTDLWRDATVESSRNHLRAARICRAASEKLRLNSSEPLKQTQSG